MNNLTKLLYSSERPSRKIQIIAVFSLAWPSIIEQIMLTAIQYINTAMVGSLGANATAAIGVNSSTIWLFNGILAAAGVGFSVQIAQFIGAQRIKSAKDVVRQSLLFNIIFGFIIGLIAVLISFRLPYWLGADREIISDASVYFRIIGFSMPFLLSSNLFSSILRCMGDTKTPMALNILINIFNVILNILFIYETREITFFGHEFIMWGAGLGVTGAAIGSAISAAIVSVLFILVLFMKDTNMKISIHEPYHFTKRCLRTTYKIGMPVALERAAISIAQIVITIMVAKLGTISIAANTLAVTAESLCYLPAFGISAAATTLVGQAIGAGREDLAKAFSRISLYTGMIFMTITGVLLYVYAGFLISIFTKDAAVIVLGTEVLRIEAFAEPLFAASIVATGVLRGAGDTKWPFIINLVSMWGVRLTIAGALVKSVGLVGVWIAMCTELWVRGIIFLIRLYSNKWLKSGKIT